jgi:dynein heavy chain 1
MKGWETLYATLDEHMGGLTLMKNSPFFRSVREFQEENKQWEDRLTKLRGVFDLLLNVKRRWVYLEGIFLGTSDIKGRLPVEWSRFRSVDGEFISLMRRITSRPFAMEILNIDNVDRTLERLDVTMNTTQRALGEYLWTQRNDFSRFYFLGDDDLLEIIGNSGRTSIVTSHIGKMFSGLGGVKSRTISEAADSVEYIEAMVSKDGKEVSLRNDITVEKNIIGVESLRQLESEMYTTLGDQLESAVRERALSRHIRAQIELNKSSTNFTILDWIKRFPDQILMLSILIGWTEDVEDSFRESDCRSRLQSVLMMNVRSLDVLSQQTTINLTSVEQKKIEQVISELVYERDILEDFIHQGVDTSEDFRWQSRLRFKYDDGPTQLQRWLSMI